MPNHNQDEIQDGAERGVFTRRRFIQFGLMAGVVVLLPRSVAGQAVATRGRPSGAGRVVIVPEAAWPQPASFSKYAARAVFTDAAEANRRVRGRKYPIQIRAK